MVDLGTETASAISMAFLHPCISLPIPLPQMSECSPKFLLRDRDSVDSNLFRFGAIVIENPCHSESFRVERILNGSRSIGGRSIDHRESSCHELRSSRSLDLYPLWSSGRSSECRDPPELFQEFNRQYNPDPSLSECQAFGQI